MGLDTETSTGRLRTQPGVGRGEEGNIECSERARAVTGAGIETGTQYTRGATTKLHGSLTATYVPVFQRCADQPSASLDSIRGHSPLCFCSFALNGGLCGHGLLLSGLFRLWLLRNSLWGGRGFLAVRFSGLGLQNREKMKSAPAAPSTSADRDRDSQHGVPRVPHAGEERRRTLEAGFFEPARDAGFLAVVDGGFADAREVGFAEAAREGGFEPASAALLAGLAAAFDAGFAAAFDGGFEPAFEAGFVYVRPSCERGAHDRQSSAAEQQRAHTFFAGGASSPSAGSAPLASAAAGAAASFSLSSASRSAAVRFLPFLDLGFSAAGGGTGVSLSVSFSLAAGTSPAGAFVFFARGLAGAFFAGGSALGCSLIREERRGAAASASAGAAGLRGMVCRAAGTMGTGGGRGRERRAEKAAGRRTRLDLAALNPKSHNPISR